MINKLLKSFLSIIIVFSIFALLMSASTSNNYIYENKIDSSIINTPGIHYNVLIRFVDTIDNDKIASDAIKNTKLTSQQIEIIKGEVSEYKPLKAEQNDFIDQYRKEKTSLYQIKYLEQNNQYIDKYLSKSRVLFVSRLSPFVLASLTYSECIELSKINDILYIGNCSEKNEECLDDSTNYIGSQTINSTYGFTGDGIKIGMVESGVAPITAAGVVWVSETTRESIHAKNVAECINAVAPNAQIYCASTNTLYSDYSNTAPSTYAAIEYLIIEKSVHIINQSYCSRPHSYYTVECMWMDHIAIQHDVHFVVSAGNYGNTGEPTATNGGVMSPSMSYNAVTVGNVNTTNSTHCINDNSSYTNYNYGSTIFAYKPDICAPGTQIRFNNNVSSGTSFSAPFVAGAIALMCEQNTYLKVQQNVVKAILAAAVNDTEHHYVPDDYDASESNNYSHFGAGILSCTNARTTINYGRFSHSYFTRSEILNSTEKTYSFNVTSGMTKIRVALAYLATVKLNTDGTNTSSTNFNTFNIPNIDIELFHDGVSIGSSSTLHNNVEIIEYTIPQGATGTYTVVIKPAAGNQDPMEKTHYGIAWW